MDTQDFLPDLSKTLGAFTNSLMQSFPAGDLVLKHSNSTSMKYSEDWVSGTIPPDLTYRQAKVTAYIVLCSDQMHRPKLFNARC